MATQKSTRTTTAPQGASDIVRGDVVVNIGPGEIIELRLAESDRASMLEKAGMLVAFADSINVALGRAMDNQDGSAMVSSLDQFAVQHATNVGHGITTILTLANELIGAARRSLAAGGEA